MTEKITPNTLYDKPVQQAVHATQPQGGDGEGYVEYLWDTRTDSDGVYVWEARAWDDSGNMGASPALLVRVKNNPDPPPEDTTPPVINWLSPQAGDTLEGTVELRFQVLDDVGLDSAKIYLNGRLLQNFADGGQFFDCRVNWITSDYPDGNYIVEVRAWDSAQNLGLSDPLSVTVWNNRPRVLWVPDDYEKIQDAINASEDGDTVRVREGIYREGLRLMGKNIWLESEEGPEVTIIESQGWNDGIMVADNEEPPATIRGFRVYNGYNGINIWPDINISILNCILESFESIGINLNMSNSTIYNCLFINCETGFRAWVSWGAIYNSMFLQCGVGMRNLSVTETGLDYGWNLFWENGEDYHGYETIQTDVFDNPLFIEGSYILDNNSPAINAGKPDIIDSDGSVSDIGIYGGPYAYPIR